MNRTVTDLEQGVTQGPIARLISPEGLGEWLKPFIFPSYFHAFIQPGFGFAIHPHSGGRLRDV